MHQGADSGSRTRDKRLETSYVTTTPYPHDVNICPSNLSSLSESVFQLPIHGTGGRGGGGGGGTLPSTPNAWRS